MEDCLKVTNIKIKNNRIEYNYEIEGKWKQVLNENEKMWIECGKTLEGGGIR